MKTLRNKQKGRFLVQEGTMIEIMIVDDNATFAESLAQKLKVSPVWSSKAMRIRCLTQEIEYRNLEQYNKCDILFLDIELGPISGMNLARQLRQNDCRMVLIFVTNYKEYAPEGYEVGAFRYLEKSEIDTKLYSYFKAALTLSSDKKSSVEILCESESIPISLQSLAYIESLGHEQKLHLCNAPREILTTRQTMKYLEEMLLPHGFLRIHKGFLVNMSYIVSFKSIGVFLSNGEELPVGARSYREKKRIYMLWRAQQP